MDWSLILFVMVSSLCGSTMVTGLQRNIFMDSMTFCGKSYTVYDMDLLIMAREQTTGSNPPLRCEITIQTGYSDPYYELEIRQEAITIQDCAFRLAIYAGQSASQSIKTLSCNSKSTGVLYSGNRWAKMILTQPQDLFQPANDFTLRIRTWRDPEAPAVDESMYRLSAGAVIGIVLGLVVFIVFAIMLCWCFKTGRLPGMNEKPAMKYYSSSASRENIEKSEGGSVNVAMVPDATTDRTGSYSPASTKKSNFDFDDPRVWSSLTESTKTTSNNKNKSDDFKKPFVTDPQGGRSYADKGRGGMYEKASERTTEQRQTNAAPTNGSLGRVRGRSQYNSFKESQHGNVDLPQPDRAINRPSRKDVAASNQATTASRTRGYDDDKYRDEGNTYENFNSEPVKVYAGKQRGGVSKETTFGPDDETEVKRPSSGVFDINPDEEGYMYDYDHVKKLSNGKGQGQTNQDDSAAMGSESSILDQLKTELAKRKSLKEKNNGDKKDITVEKEDSMKRKAREREKEAPGGPKGKSEIPAEFGELDFSSLQSLDKESEIGTSDMMENPVLRGSNPAIRASVTELRPKTEESPGTKKKRRKKSENKPKQAEKNTHGSKGKPSASKPEDPASLSDPYSSGSMPPHHHPKEEVPLPPEAMAPIFTTDSDTLQHYYPYQQDQYGYQPPMGFPVVGYDAYGNPVYNYGNQPPGIPPTMPYAQAGQAAWYVQQTPSDNGPVTKAAFIMTQTTPSHSTHDHIEPYHQNQGSYDPNYGGQYGYPTADTSHPGMPGYTSTPYDPSSRRHGHKSKSKSSPYRPDQSIVPSGTVLDDPKLPPPGTTMVRSGVDPNTGVQSTQVVWTDSKPDPTDPRGHNPQITRKTITRVTAKDTEGNQLQLAPDPALQQLSFNTAQQLKAGGEEPPFLSPSKTGGRTYTPKPMYAAETPERDNVNFYTHNLPREPDRIPGSPAPPVVHEAPKRHMSIRDQITLTPHEDEYEI